MATEAKSSTTISYEKIFALLHSEEEDSLEKLVGIHKIFLDGSMKIGPPEKQAQRTDPSSLDAQRNSGSSAQQNKDNFGNNRNFLNAAPGRQAGIKPKVSKLMKKIVGRKNARPAV